MKYIQVYVWEYVYLARVRTVMECSPTKIVYGIHIGPVSERKYSVHMCLTASRAK